MAMQKVQLFSALVCSAFWSAPAAARWATPEEADAAAENIVTEYVVSKDGTYSHTMDQTTRIITEAGRSQNGTMILAYSKNTEVLTIKEAETINGDKIFKVAPENIVDRAVANSASGFDENHTITIAFPNVEIGSKVHIKAVWEHKVVVFPGTFSTTELFGNDTIESNTKISISSEIPLKMDINDPSKILDIKNSTNDGVSKIEIQQVKSMYTHAVAEGSSSVMPRKKYTSVFVSSIENYATIGKFFAPKYLELIQSGLPTSMDNILSAARSKNNFVDAANTVTSMLADKVRYQGDWRSVDGGQIPHTPEHVAEVGYGDCKDMATLTANILSKLGYQASVAFVYRGRLAPTLPKLGNLNSFNHAITYVEDHGKKYWLDPTNPQSFASGIPDDILDRQALVLGPGEPRLEKIPAPSAALNKTIIKHFVTYDAEGGAKEHIDYLLTGLRAFPMTGLARFGSIDQFTENVIRSIAGQHELISAQSSKPDLTSRVVSDLSLQVDVAMNRYATWTTAGLAVTLSGDEVAQITNLNTSNTVLDLFLGYPRDSMNITVIKSAKLVGHPRKPCVVDSPWAKASRSVKPIGNDIVVTNEIEYKAVLIPNEILKSGEFKITQNNIRECFGEQAVVFQPKETRKVSH